MTDDHQMRHFGPMHGERSRRHQMTAESNSRREPPERGILSIYEVARDKEGVPAEPRLYVEVMNDGHIHMLKLTIDEAREVAGAVAEFVRVWQDG
jgi:hypothetical protein